MKTLTFACCLLLITCYCHAETIGSQGNLYAIAEPDAAQEIETKMASVDWTKVFDPERLRKSADAVRPKGIRNLPRAKMNNIFLVDMTYILDHDIPDGKGGILYPEGFSFNPLDYIKYPFTLVVIDGSDREQVQWFIKSPYGSDPTVKLVITAGSAFTLADQINREVTYAPGLLLDRFKLKAVPSVIRQLEAMMQIREVRIETHNAAR